MSSWFASHGDDVGITSSCSHHIHITLMMSSRSDHDVIAACVNHSCSHGATLRMTDRPFVHDVRTMVDNM